MSTCIPPTLTFGRITTTSQILGTEYPQNRQGAHLSGLLPRINSLPFATAWVTLSTSSPCGPCHQLRRYLNLRFSGACLPGQGVPGRESWKNRTIRTRVATEATCQRTLFGATLCRWLPSAIPQEHHLRTVSSQSRAAQRSTSLHSLFYCFLPRAKSQLQRRHDHAQRPSRLPLCVAARAWQVTSTMLSGTASKGVLGFTAAHVAEVLRTPSSRPSADRHSFKSCTPFSMPFFQEVEVLSRLLKSPSSTQE